MKKLTIIFGGTVGLYMGHFRVFDSIEKKFKCKVRRISAFRFRTKINSVKVELRFCLNPIRDKNYYQTKKFQETTEWKELMPLPANELVKKIKSDKVLFLGLCGSFKGKKSDIHIPKESKEVFFKDTYIKHKEILKIKAFNKIEIKNFLEGKIKGKKSKVVTSNITLAPGSIEKRNKEYLILLAEKLSKYGNAVDKEIYQIAKHFKNKIPLGILLMTSDVLTVKRHMIQEKNFKPNKKKFNSYCIKAIETALDF